MALAMMGTLDLSIITDQLLKKLQVCYDNSPLWGQKDALGHTVDKFTVHIDGAMPEAGRALGDTVLSFYLFHVNVDRFLSNSAVNPPAKPVIQRIPGQPLALDLMYLLTAWNEKNYVYEQRVMSIAMRCLHNAPIIRGTVPIGTGSATEEYTLTLQPQSSDELGRLWQSFSGSFRLSAVYKASVVFITPDAPNGKPAPEVARVAVSASPAEPMPLMVDGQLLGTLSTTKFFASDSTVAAPRPQTIDYAPAVAEAGDDVQLIGGNLTQARSVNTYLIDSSGNVVDVTSWADPNPLTSTEVRRRLELPKLQGAAPARTPAPGIYQLRVGDAGGPLSNSTPFSIAARVSAAPNPPLLSATAGLYTLPGAGFKAGATDLMLGPVALVPVAAGPAAGQFSLVPAGISFVPPSSLSGLFPVRVRVRSVGPPPTWVESPPQWAVSL
jgi:hypothetical protein